MIWVWISDITGMPLAVQKCDFEPNINHTYIQWQMDRHGGKERNRNPPSPDRGA